MRIDQPAGLAASEPSWSLLEIDAQQPLLRHFAGSPLACTAPADADVRRVLTGVSSTFHNGVVAARLTADTADEAIRATLRRLSGHPRSVISAPMTHPRSCRNDRSGLAADPSAPAW
jgi:hypothetical protein